MQTSEADLSDSELQKTKVKHVKTHKKSRLAKVQAQKILTKEEAGVTTTDLQQSGDKRIEPLFKAADSISPNELQVTRVVPQRCLPGNGQNRLGKK